MRLDAKEVIKLVLSKEGLTQKKLTEILTKQLNKKFTPDGLSRKLNRGTTTYNEVSAIIDILGYEINIDEK